MAPSIDKWAELILSDDETWTGWPFADQWAEHDGPVPIRNRLHPAIPFVCGGSYDVDNLRPVDAVDLMRAPGHIARQIHHLPDGAKIKIVVTD